MSLTRSEHGSGHTYKLDGGWAPGVTSVLRMGYPHPGLIDWAGKATAEWAVDHWDELAEMSVSERLKALMGARFADRDEAGRRGTEVHTLAQKLLAGGDVEIPEPLIGHVDSYLKFLDEWDVREVLVETVIARRTPRYCGTLDMIADLADGNRWLVDLKTTRKGVYSENACQLAGYRFADFYVDADGEEQPIPEVDRTGVVWIRADGYDLIPVEAGVPEFRLFQMTLEVARFDDWNWRKRDGRNGPIGAPLTPPVKETADD